MANDYESFVDRNRAELVQRVSSVMPLADVLMSRGMLKNEPYSEIQAERTSQAKMRALFRFLKGRNQKVAFFHALKKNEPFLVEELEHGPRPEGPTEASHGTQESSSGARHGEEDSEKVEIALEERWHKISQRWQAKLQDLLKEQNLQSVGNRKLFLCTEANYEIGAGCNGTTVYIGMKADGTEVAIKRMVKSCNKELQNEMSLLRAPELESCYIVKYVDFVEDEAFYYLALQLCEYTLEEYMEHIQQKEEEDKWKALRKVAKEVLLGLKVLHDNGVLHRDIKPQNVLIDVKENTRLADFGFSRRLNSASTRITRRAGTQGWEAAEILDDENENEGNVEYKKSSDMQVAGMLVHYILSEGHHPFGKGRRIEQNIIDGKAELHQIILQDVEAKDLIEEMIHKDPKKRLTIGEAIDHPYFWDDARRDFFLRKVGDEKAVQRYLEVDQTLCDAVAKYTEGRSVSGWKHKIPTDNPDMLSVDSKLPDNLLGLLRYFRNSLVHPKKKFVGFEIFKDLYPDFFICANKLAKEMRWTD
ncbi:serine/threonine-protein kinase/endoribonuclease ire-1-like isoform X1 [Astyanax mexicanus]|uniref:Serine/threonine-protein kinase/endoribonuclease ire-1-like isoform X1 n=1 Tax=Astyanax mexicanus TaxID=7994 RepID=A0A8T2KYD9_ASTMX|nr:serine/threonine-protein kinase/endoribonuclease ire-1-like isoform X1 [Astyanax mexicanus]